ncbi:DUF7935 family protein [Roseivirga misakiensis]|uniref:Uncharacterized protein n=1 Tax=Roseivirga misakiensis TaxID=1563681 RepID=A0A1E5SKL5_9BACT|nr:hypothetical protein [Roseivirga misakiensis]OEJ99633.1 hypothetical protein BFP71_08660 [Roseivirga misakiensis]
MDTVTELLKVLIPALLVMYAMYLVVRNFLQKQFDNRLLDLKIKNNETVLPIRLQAYERIALLLERISPNNMLIRLSDPSLSAFAFQQLLLKEIREEFNHNLSQQVYMSEDVWNKVKATVNDIVSAVQDSAQKMDDSKNAIDLAEEIFAYMIGLDRDPVGEALAMVRNETQHLF